MAKQGQKLILTLLRIIRSIKRGIRHTFRFVRPALSKLYAMYQKTIGFYTYKAVFRCKKWFGKLTGGATLTDIVGKRSVLQIIIFGVGIIIMLPQSSLHTKELTSTVGKETTLYKLLAPEEFYIDEIIVESADQVVVNNRSWREGAVSPEGTTEVISEAEALSKQLTSVTVGGGAIIKPNILPGTELPVIEEDGVTVGKGRRDITTYIVKSGDTIGGIAQSQGVSLTTILTANGLTSRSYIRPGDELTILPVDGITHKVKSGDTVSRIARLYSAKSEDIIAQNKLKNDGSDIVIGETLIVPGGRKAPTYVAPKRTVNKTTAIAQRFSQVAAPPASASTPAGSGYIWPANTRIITQYYGWRHGGLDIAGKMGTAIYAAKGGTVTKASHPSGGRCSWNSGYGCYIVIDHGGGIKTLYAHNTKLFVNVGDRVSQGQTIALMGSTGRSTGPHLHFEVRVGGSRQNPLRYIR